MEDLIKKIVDMDKRAREMTDEARSRRTRSAELIAQKKESKRQEYMLLAQRRIEVIRQEEMSAAAERLKETEAKEAGNSARVLGIAGQKKTEWVAELVRRATEV